jgi:hypothetical protein
MHSIGKFFALIPVVFPWVLLGQGAAIPNPADSVLTIARCADFSVSGDGSNPEWTKAQWITFGQRGSNASYKTMFKILYSGKGIYCLFFCEDQKISATLQGENQDLYREDVVEAFFWADERIPVYFEYELSPLNYELVLMVPNYDGRFLGWIPWHYSGERVTQHAVHLEPGQEKNRTTSWTGEFFLPYELMRPMVQAAPEKGTRWRANFYRIDYDNRPARWSWMPVQSNFHDYVRFGTILFN